MTTGTSNEAGFAAAPKRRRRAWPFVTLAIVLVVLIVGFFVADAAAKAYARDRISTQLASALGLPASTQVAVDVGSGPILLQALAGSLSTVDVQVPQLAFGSLVGAAELRATNVPLDTSKPVGTLSVTYTITEKSLAALAGQLSGTAIDSVTLKSPEILAAASVSVLGAKIPVGLGLTPTVSQGKLVFTPSNITVAGQTFTSQQLLASPLFGSLAKTLLHQQSFCVAQYLPKALTATSVRVVDKTLVLTFTGNGAVLGGSDFAAKGSCS